LRDPEARELVESLEQASDVETMSTAILAALWGIPAGALPTDLDALDLVRAHPLVHQLVEKTVHAAHEDDLVAALFPNLSDRGTGRELLAHLLATLSHIRANVGLEALSVTLHLWVRELTRIDRTAEAGATYRWSDDGVHLAEAE